MAGCFGNSIFDRCMEQQLFRHLDKEAEWDEFCDRVVNEIPVEVWDDGLDLWFFCAECDEILKEYGQREYVQFNFKEIADKIVEAYKNNKK